MASKKKKEQKQEEQEEKIFVIVPLSVQVEAKHGDEITIRMPVGRLAAQTAHVVSAMRLSEESPTGDEPITTIVLTVRNSKELSKVLRELNYGEIAYSTFHDQDEKFYGTKDDVFTAICTWPCTKDQVDDIIGHLELL